MLVRNDRVISTGYNGTPAKFLNCREGGCVRCEERHRHDEDPTYQSPHPEVMQGKALDICLCFHAEQNALLSAARHGIAVEGSVLYAKHQPCFSCLKESIQAGVQQVIFLKDWYGAKDQRLRGQYDQQLKPSARFSGFDQLDENLVRTFTGNVAPCSRMRLRLVTSRRRWVRVPSRSL